MTGVWENLQKSNNSIFRFHRPWVFPPPSYINIPADPKMSPKKEDAQNCPKRPSSALASPLRAVRANPCYSDGDSQSPAIVLLLWCYTPVSLLSKCYSSCAIVTVTPFVLSPTVLICSCSWGFTQLQRQSIAASSSECPRLTRKPVIVDRMITAGICVMLKCGIPARHSWWHNVMQQRQSCSCPQVGISCESAAYKSVSAVYLVIS